MISKGIEIPQKVEYENYCDFMLINHKPGGLLIHFGQKTEKGIKWCYIGKNYVKLKSWEWKRKFLVYIFRTMGFSELFLQMWLLGL